MKLRDAFGDWPPRAWAADDSASSTLTGTPGELRLLWFSAPDADGWFLVTATDRGGASWSTYCRTPAAEVWPPLERALVQSLKQPLDLVGDVDL